MWANKYSREFDRVFRAKNTWELAEALREFLGVTSKDLGGADGRGGVGGTRRLEEARKRLVERDVEGKTDTTRVLEWWERLWPAERGKVMGLLEGLADGRMEVVDGEVRET
jgi:hypothetical protein